ncbi:MAG: YdeI/OmpD-associated family protein [Anaerolineales bacterium]|jgi:uncharacterized protein YdeI (YjbR/CyaY-like superfamily)
MKAFERVQVESRAELRAWLEANHTRTESVWLVTYKKHVPEKYISWDEVVEEALCFGWIDSLPRKLDAERSMLLLSPRRAGSPWSRLNKQRVAKLQEAGLIMPSGLATIEQAKADGSWTLYDEIEELVIPDDLAQALKADQVAAENFYAFSDSSKKGILWWLKSAKTPATRQKRIAEIVRYARHNLRASFPEARAFDRQQGRAK